MRRYSREAILRALEPIIPDAFGLDSDELPLPGESIPDHLKRCGIWDDCDLYDLVFLCEKSFGRIAPKAEWLAFFNGVVADPNEWERLVAPGLTYDRLADFIAERVWAVSFEPIEIAGRRCGPAGAFVGLRETAGLLFPDRERFAPSTPILPHLRRSRLEGFWARLQWDRGDAVPALRRCASDALSGGVFLWTLGMGMPAGACLCAGEPDIALMFVALAAMVLLPFLALRAAENPLPAGIETFGDLARRLAATEERAAAAR